MSQLAETKSADSPKVSSYISFKNETDGTLHFTLDNINVSFANGIRRTILSDIPTLVFNCFPHKNCDAIFHKNTSRLNNEILKQRLSCIPIHLTDHDLPYSELVVEIDMKNESENTIDVTTEYFKVKNEKTGKYLKNSVVKKMFPPCPITNDYILFARLRPEISGVSTGEEISIHAKMSLHTANEDGAFNVASTCAYKFTPDKIKQDEAWQSILSQMSAEEKEDTVNLTLRKKNWYNHEGMRHHKNDSFEFKLESVGVFENTYLVWKACDILIEKLNKIATEAITGETLPCEKSINTIQNSFDITLINNGYTIGKRIEYMLHKNYYQGDKVKLLSYVGFRKNHPHDEDSIIRIGFIQDNLGEGSLEVSTRKIVKEACEDAISLLNSIKPEFI